MVHYAVVRFHVRNTRERKVIMPGVRSRTPIAPELIHDPAQVALDQARLSEIGNLIPKDVVERLIRETNRRVRRNALKHPSEIVMNVVWGPVFFVVSLAVELVERYYCWRHPEERARRREIARTRERPPADFIRGAFAATWVDAIDEAFDRSEGKPVELGPDLFPAEFPSGNAGLAAYDSWCNLIAHQCGNDLDDRAVAALMDAFALHMGAVIRSHGRQGLPLGITVRWADGRFTARRAMA